MWARCFIKEHQTSKVSAEMDCGISRCAHSAHSQDSPCGMKKRNKIQSVEKTGYLNTVTVFIVTDNAGWVWSLNFLSKWIKWILEPNYAKTNSCYNSKYMFGVNYSPVGIKRIYYCSHSLEIMCIVQKTSSQLQMTSQSQTKHLLKCSFYVQMIQKKQFLMCLGPEFVLWK